MNSSFRKLVIFSAAPAALTSLALAQSSVQPEASMAGMPATVAQPTEPVEHLAALVVTGTIDSKTAFDLAQGASQLSGEQLRLHQEASLGETLSTLPGVTSTYYGPGASRPIIRGLGGDRVRMLQDSIGSLDLSNISPDHNVSIEPLLTERIEVLRGPATLLYGSSAVGGVVNVLDNRIPYEAADRVLQAKVEARFDTAAQERTGILSLSGGTERFAYQVNGLRLRSEDVSIPGYAQQGPEAAEEQAWGVLPGSAISTKSASVGGTAFWEKGSLGLALSTYATVYGVPTGDEPPISLDMKQERIDLKGQVNSLGALFKTLRIKAAYANYEHSELSGGSTVNTHFQNKAFEGRMELVQQALGKLNGTVGVQFGRTDFEAKGEEVVTPPTLTEAAALFALEEYKFEQVTFQFGGRVEGQRIRLGAVNPELPLFDGFSAQSGERRNFTGLSLSAGLVYYPVHSYSLAFSVASSERLPLAQELYSNGPHGGTGAYEVGRSSLGKERSLGLDLTLRRRGDSVTGSVGVFVNRFKNYIFEEQLPEELTPVVNNPDALTPYQFVGKDALFYGYEAELEFHLIDRPQERLHWIVSSDYVHAEQTQDHEPLPRIPPLRVGSELRYQYGAWTAGITGRFVFAQKRYTANETETASYALLGADLAYRFQLGQSSYDVYLRASNLLDREARVHSSFLKDYAPLPGRNFVVGLRASF